MSEKFYGLLREYTLVVQERDAAAEQAKSAIDGPEKEEVRRKLDLLNKRCRLLRQEIRKHPGISLQSQSARQGQ